MFPDKSVFFTSLKIHGLVFLPPDIQAFMHIFFPMESYKTWQDF